MATKFIFKFSITSQLVLFWLHSNFCFLTFHLLRKNKIAYWKSASLVAWKCLKSSCWGGGGWLPSHYQVKLQLMLRLSRAVNILNIVKIWGRFHCPCPWDACYQSVLATWDEIITGPVGLASRNHWLQYSPDETKNPTSNQAGWPEWTISPWPS